MHFLVRAEDAEDVGQQLLDLAEAHWQYLDAFANQVILRGPTLSHDASEHTGSIHILDLPDRTAAEDFACNEPYWSAGLYRDVAIDRVVTLARDTPLDASSMLDPIASSFVTGVWLSPHSAQGTKWSAQLREVPQNLMYCGLLVDDAMVSSTGIVAAIHEAPPDALDTFRSVAHLAGEVGQVVAKRWRRGGRMR